MKWLIPLLLIGCAAKEPVSQADIDMILAEVDSYEESQMAPAPTKKPSKSKNRITKIIRKPNSSEFIIFLKRETK